MMCFGGYCLQEDDDMLVPPQDFNDGIEPMEGV